MTCVVISQPMYLPWVGFLAQLSLADVLIWLDDAQFSKGSFTNRVQVPKGNATGWISIPLEGKGSHRAISELAPAQEDWVTRHRSTLRNTYGQSPHFPEVERIMDHIEGASSVSEAIIASSEALARAVGVSLPDAPRSTQMGLSGHGSDRVLRLVQAMGGTRYLTGMGARNYLDHDAFEAAGITVEYMDYAPLPWPQPGRSFSPYVTGLDLVANVAPDARNRHLNPATQTWRKVMEGQGG